MTDLAKILAVVSLSTFLNLCSFFQATAFASDKLSIAVPFPVSEINPLALRDPINRIILENIGWGLAALQPDGSVKLQIAKKISSNANQSEWTAILREDVNFTSTKALTAANVRDSFFSLRHQAKLLKIKRENHGTQRASEQSVPNELITKLLNIVDIKVVDHGSTYYAPERVASELTFTLKEPDAKFDSWVLPLPILDPQLSKHFGSDFGKGTNVVFAGPYRVIENRPDGLLVLGGIPDFYLPSLPHTKTIKVKEYPQAKLALSALRVGSVDIIALPTTAQLDEVDDDPTLTTRPSPLKSLSSTTGDWELKQNYWSEQDSEADMLRTDLIIVRKSLKLDESALNQFNLSASFLP